MNINRHKVFISYYHHDDQQYKEYLEKMKFFNYEKFSYESIFDDYSVRNGDIDDSFMSDEAIRVKIRDDYIKDATVLVLLCGRNTKYRKHVDWEIHAAMFDSEKNPKMGILIINLPEINQSVRACDDEEKQMVSPQGNWISLETRNQYEEYYPFMPDRIIDNFVKKQDIAVVNWNAIKDNPSKLMFLIDKAYRRRITNFYDHSRILRRRNS